MGLALALALLVLAVQGPRWEERPHALPVKWCIAQRMCATNALLGTTVAKPHLLVLPAALVHFRVQAAVDAQTALQANTVHRQQPASRHAPQGLFRAQQTRPNVILVLRVNHAQQRAVVLAPGAITRHLVTAHATLVRLAMTAQEICLSHVRPAPTTLPVLVRRHAPLALQASTVMTQHRALSRLVLKASILKLVLLPA